MCWLDALTQYPTSKGIAIEYAVPITNERDQRGEPLYFLFLPEVAVAAVGRPAARVGHGILRQRDDMQYGRPDTFAPGLTKTDAGLCFRGQLALGTSRVNFDQRNLTRNVAVSPRNQESLDKHAAYEACDRKQLTVGLALFQNTDLARVHVV